MNFGVTQTGEGRPLVLLHGVGVDHTIWDPVLPLLVERCRAVTVDLPGFGASSPAGRGFDLRSVALRTADGLRRVGIEEPYDLLGQSLGGSVAVVLASERPSSVDRLVLGAPPGFVTGSWLRAQAFGAGTAAFVRARRFLGPRLVDSRRARRVMFAGAISDGARLSAGQARAMIESSRSARRVYAGTAVAVETNLAPLLRALSTPLGLIWGERDNTVKLAVAAEIQRIRPGTPLEVVAGSGHIPHVEAPGEFAAALDRLLARLAEPG